MARQMIDYLLDTDEDLLIKDGDWATGESTYQHQRQLILNAKGDYKANPTICADVTRYIDNDDKSTVKREIAKEFMRDGMLVKDLVPNRESVSDGTALVFNNSFYV
jgi:hypothetical protein